MKKNSIIAGVLTSGFVFGGGYLLSELIWRYIDGGYAHGPGLSHLFLLMLFLLCIAWTVVAFVKRNDEKRNFFWRGSGFVNILFLVAAIGLVLIDINKGSGEENDVPMQSLTIVKDSSGGVVLNQDSDTLFYRKKDSVLIDRTKRIYYETLKLPDSIK